MTTLLTTAWIVGAFMFAVVQASFFEWVFHRYWLHRPWLPKDVFTAHTLVHHQLCKFDDTFHVTEHEQEEALTFQWWGGPFLVLLNVVPWAATLWILSSFGVHVSLLVLLIPTAVLGLYYAGYEGFHYLMHKPSIPFVERRRVFQFLKRHHRIHHVHMDRNLNVLLPIADLVLGTLVLNTSFPAVTPESARRLARRHSGAATKATDQSR
ncbi:MAG: hypothetical protein E6K80_01575 [Candidatus Eisenbacteria bacterium]|uniref:Fatty acid hydroxylase n=1 Tax=Eiseniibacteriota bacterium TaxID=2212470 RepID=A0A538UAF6_UNCEI|nr:MAG: hypothetical protein E6K80_01575 [Candidatus Eisenbacteria bacterium]